MKKNSIEENIKILENLIECFRKAEIVALEDIESMYQKCSYSDYKAIVHILSDYKRVLKENETLKAFTKSIFNGDIEKEVIPVQKVKNKIEELKNNLHTIEHYETIGAIHVLRELIESED